MGVNKNFLVFNFGAFLMFTSLSGLVSIMSSINIQEGIGVTALAVAYGVSLIAALIVPNLIEKVGYKKIFILSELGYLLFVLSNIYPSYNILVGGFIQGISEAVAWTAMPLLCTLYSKRHSEKGSKVLEDYTNNYTGYFFFAIQAAMISGNAIGFLIFHIDRTQNSSNGTIQHHVDFQFCGLNDCQLPNTTSHNLSQYTALNSIFLYVAIGTFCSLQLVAIILHMRYLPSNKSWKNQRVQSIQTSELVACTSVQEEPCPNNSPKHQPTKNIFQNLKTSIIETMRLYIHPKHLLITVLTIYNGMSLAFVISELTRAYASCLLGLDKVGVGSMIYGAADALVSILIGRIVSKVGRNFLFVIAGIVDTVCYVVCLLSLPNEQNAWMVYMLFFCFGISDGIWQPLINAMYGHYFPKQKVLAYNIWNIDVNIGYLVQFAISTSLCIRSKIYIQLVIMAFGLTFYCLFTFCFENTQQELYKKLKDGKTTVIKTNASQCVYYRRKTIDN